MAEPSSDPTPHREDTDDHDLLTYSEAGVRVFMEVENQRKLVATLTSDGAPSEQIERAQTRLSALEDAQERNRRQPINDENFEQFFGYKGTPRRNT